MASNWTICGVCDSLEITKPSVVWCSECDEGLCTECDKHHAVSKASRNHSTISITEYSKLPTSILEIPHTCSTHNERYQTYCRKHDCPCCHRCVIETHNGCKDIIAIDDIIKDVKSSNALSDIEQMLVEVAENIEKITKDRKDNLKSIMDKRRKVEKEIQQIRMKKNSHLDQIQEDLIKELNTKEEKERKKIENLLTTLEKKRKEIDECRKTILNIKQHASDLQTFLAIKQMEKNVFNEERFLETLATSESLRQFVLSFNNDGTFEKISNFKSIGHIEVKMIPDKVVVTRIKGTQAQMGVASSSPRLIEDIKLNLKKTIKTGLNNTTGCLILPDGRLVLSGQGTSLIRFFNTDGDEDFKITSKRCNVIDITFIPEDNTIAATSGMNGKHCINIISIKDRKISREISVNSSYYGVVYNDSKLTTCAQKEGLHILRNGSCEVIQEVKIEQMSSFSYVAVFDNKLYYTNYKLHSVTCCDMKGIIIWTIKDESVFKYPKGVTVDNDGNVYVASSNSSNVIIISSDGKQCLELLSANDDLFYPTVLDFDRSTNQLLVANVSETAFLYQVTGKN